MVDDYNRNDIGESLIEMRFIAGGQEHYLRRIQGSTTTDIHLYVGTERDKFSIVTAGQ